MDLPKPPMLAPAEIAHNFTGYEFGGTSPFGTKVPNIPVYIDQDAAELKEKVYINGGSTELMVEMDMKEIIRLTNPKIGSFSM